MTRFLAISDVHAHPFSYGASFVPYGTYRGLHNSRLVDTLAALSDAADYAVDNGISVVLFGGDLYHTRQSVKTVVCNMVTHVIKEKFIDRGIKFVAIPGNHDYADRAGNVHSLQPLGYLSSDIHILDSVQAVEVEKDLIVVSVPYTDSVKKARADLVVAAGLANQYRDKTTVLLCHLGVQGARVGSDYVLVCPSDVDSDNIPFSSFDICLFGHYHQHQMLAKNAWYIGALTQQTWSDVGGDRGFLDVGVAPADIGLLGSRSAHEVAGRQAVAQDGRRIPATRVVTSAPKFVVCTDEKDLAAVRSVDFVTYFTEQVLTETQQTTLRSKCLATQFDIKPIKKDKAPELQLDSAQLNAEAALEPWVKLHAGNLDQNALLDLGKELLSIGQNHEV